jgi:hypothetical protein
LAASSFGAAFGMSSDNPSPFVALFAAMVANRTACVLVCLLVSLLVCLLVCLVACLFACLLACVGVMERTSSHQSSESVRSNLEAELWIPDGEMRNQQRNPPAINPQEEQTNKQTHFLLQSLSTKATSLDPCYVRSVRASFDFSS